jgi:hypothetical protein
METCPLCNHVMQSHLYKTVDERIVELFFCDSCECDFIPCGYDEWLALTEPMGTRPIDVTHTREATHHAQS